MEVVGRGGGENLDSQNLRDFLRIREEENPNHITSSSTSSGGGGGLTLFAVLSDKRAPPPPQLDEPMQRVNSNRTLLDIIREDQTSGLGIDGGGRRDARRSWRHLKDKIRLRRRGNDDVWSSSTAPIPSSDVPLNNNQRMLMMSRRPSTRFNSSLDSSESTQPNPRTNYRSASGRYEHLMTSSPRRRLIIEEEEERSGETVDEVATAGGGASDQPVRMSLMALLEETDRQMGLERSSFVMVEEDEDVGEDISGGAAVNGGGYNNCCVCMVRHKGAAFIPCGHTFCRLCSRELWVQRGHCPLCNNYILEILDIF